MLTQPKEKVYIEPGCEELFIQAADRLCLEPIYEKPDNAETPYLFLCADGLTLVKDKLTLRGDFSHMLKRIGASKLSGELIVKAARIKAEGVPTVSDMTAGLGEDSFLLAAAGWEVILFEHNPIIHALLSDALYRATLDPLLEQIASHMSLHSGDSVSSLSLYPSPDVVFLDPMFPPRQKSGLVKKKLQLLQALEGPCEDEKQMLDAAFNATPRKIVVKRPSKGHFLAQVKPSYSVEGDGIRYDCYVL